ncbi:MAG: DUF4105 domain-containing protein [Prevotella sp.]|nr:DUF4105 domain-containing protein [Prevotella sp.]
MNSIMKHTLAVILMMTVQCVAATEATDDDYLLHADSTIHISLLTCQPGQEVYSLYGHTAIHYINDEKGIDVAINYGMFSFSKPHFVLRFVFGLTDYEMGVQGFQDFCNQYAYFRRGIIEQHLNIPAEDKLLFAEAVERNYLPENREYRYNYFYDNCTTRARDIILGKLKDCIHYKRSDNGESFRMMIHQFNEEHPWARFGNDMLLGVMADRPTTVSEQQFLPDNLMKDFENATFTNGTEAVPVVKETTVVVPDFKQEVKKEFPLRPRECFLILLVITIAVTVIEMYSKKRMWIYDLILMILSGLAGCILFVMIFSQHPTVRINLQLLLLNPLPLFFIRRLIIRRRNTSPDRLSAFWILLICLFFIGSIWQTYAEGMYLVASSLLIRNIVRIK